ncbi:hypothetical protein EJB05_49506 [Eragrostis curvula]|uniref:Uncharacterized protein n=1 Tax=Eragrostis curvula TaxID=38414 RepID=A0A5J9T4E8_9POAL|nr:hypothetical protein EJB05_49506 [Eragrostis curvula]
MYPDRVCFHEHKRRGKEKRKKKGAAGSDPGDRRPRRRELLPPPTPRAAILPPAPVSPTGLRPSSAAHCSRAPPAVRRRHQQQVCPESSLAAADPLQDSSRRPARRTSSGIAASQLDGGGGHADRGQLDELDLGGGMVVDWISGKVTIGVCKLRRDGDSDVATGDRIADKDGELVIVRRVDEEDTSMAAAEQLHVPAGGGGGGAFQREAFGRDAIWRIQQGGESNIDAASGSSGGKVDAVLEKAEKGRLPVVRAEAAEEPRVRDEAPQALAHQRRAGERGRLRRQAEEDLAEDVFVV